MLLINSKGFNSQMRPKAKRVFWLACVLVVELAHANALTQAEAPATLSAEGALARVRVAVGYERLRAHRTGVLAEGTARVGGLDSKLTLLFTPDGHFRTDIEGPLGSVTGFDGSAAWELDWSGMPRLLELEDLELAQLEAAFRSGRWLADDGPFDVSVDAAKTDDKQVAFNLALKRGLLNATVFVDRATWLPKTVTRRGVGGEEVMGLGDYRETLGFRFPHRVTRTLGGTTSFYEITTVAAAPGSSLARYRPVTAHPADTRWDAATPARLEVRRVRSGHLLVHPLVNGQ